MPIEPLGDHEADIAAGLLGEPVAVHLGPKQGWVNRVWFGAGTRSRAVLRLCPLTDSAAGFAREAWCIEAARDVGVPGPYVLGVGTEAETGWGWMAMSWLPGRMLEELPDEDRAVWEVLGRYAARIGSISVAGVGEGFGYSGGSPVYADWGAWTAARVEEWEGGTHLVDRGAIDSHSHRRVREALTKMSSWAFEPRLCHGDLGWDNALVTGDGAVSVIDWGGASATRLHMPELSNLFTFGSEAALAGYLAGAGISAADMEDIRADVDAYRVWGNAACLLQWLPESTTPWNDNARTAQGFLRGILQRVAPST